MAKKVNKTQSRNPQITFIVKNVAEMTGFTPDYIYKIIAGERKNNEVLGLCMDLLEGSNVLVEEVKKLIPFN